MFSVRKVLKVLLLAVTASICQQYVTCQAKSTGFDSKMTIFRLPKTTRPVNYTLEIVPYFGANPYFTGLTKVFVKILQETNEIWLHSKYITIEKVDMGCNASFKMDENNELLRIEACKSLNVDAIIELRISYRGLMNHSVGFYQSSYRVDGKTKLMAATQFEPTFARMAFPCYDEPEYRTPFQLYLSPLSNQSTIANMPFKMKQYDNQISPRVWNVFEPTPPMATYLLAFAFFEYACERPVDGTTVCSRENVIGDAIYASKIGRKIVTAMEEYTGKRFLLPKLQFMSIPENYFGAMENWGLITFRESMLLFNEEIDSEKNLETVTSVICHEIAHQWFGDYVTPLWWDYVWLNEGFATYFEYYLMDQLHPSWRMRDYLVIDEMQTALFQDQARVYHPLTATLKTPSEIESVFDIISYKKGASILRMVEHMVTPEVFQNSLKLYLNIGWTDYNGTVTPDILWYAFDQKVKEYKIPLHTNVSNIMKKWTSNEGYPLIEVSKAPFRGTLKVKQVNYQSPRSSRPSKSTTADWIIPISYTRQSIANFNQTDPTFWLIPYNGNDYLDDVSATDEWIIFNIQATGYYRVNYYLENWRLLILQLLQNHTKIHVLNRAQLIDDSMALAIDNLLPYYIPFEMMTYLDGELDFIPWFSALNKFEYLLSRYESTAAGQLLKEFILERISHPVRRLGFSPKPSDDHLTKTGRSALIEMACKLEMPFCIEESVYRYHKQAANLSKINPDIKKAVLCTAVNNLKNEPVWLNLWNLYRKSNIEQEKITVLFALGCTNDKELLKKYLYKLIVEKNVEIREQHHTNVFRAVFNREIGVNAGLQLMGQLLPSIAYGIIDDKSMTTTVSMLNFMKHMIVKEQQVKEVENLIFEAEQWDDNVPRNFMTALYSAYSVGKSHTKYCNKRLNSLIDALQTETPSSISSTIRPSTMTTHLTLISITLVWSSMVLKNILELGKNVSFRR